jgi:LPS-assembly lipoprotein
MSSPRRILLACLAAASMIAMAGCQVRPLYAAGPDQPGPRADLPAIEVDQPLTRDEQVYRNALLLSFRGGSAGAPPRYTLSYRNTVQEQAVVLERGTGTPNTYQLIGSSSFLLRDRATSASLFGTNVTAVASYTRSSQDFANVRARRDAEDRLALSLANLTQARLAAYFASR